jgi:hypothetical protein
MRSVDWDCSGFIEGVVSHDLNEDAFGWCGAISGFQTLSDFDEWNNIRDNTRNRSTKLDHLPVSQCIGAAEMRTYVQQRGFCPQPAAIPEPCVAGEMLYVDHDGFPNDFGICRTPLGSVDDACDIAVPGSIIFVTPGVYDEVNPVILDAGVTVTSPGRVIIK